MTINLTGRVAIVTGAGRGLGRAHALLLAAKGARVVVNDIAPHEDNNGTSAAVLEVVELIKAAGGDAIACNASVTDREGVNQMVGDTVERWGRVDILVNNAGILRDKSFNKMSIDDFAAVVDVHLMGSVNCTKAVWDHMRAQSYGRIIMTTSSSGLYGNFGQSNYGAAKMALVGLMQTLGIEGAKHNIHVNCLAPTGATHMLKGLMAPEAEEMLAPELVSPVVLALASEQAPNRVILCAGGGSVEQAFVTLTRGVHLSAGPDAADRILASLPSIADRCDEIVPAEAFEQSRIELSKAGYAPMVQPS